MVVYTADDLRNRIDELEAQLSELRENEKLLLKQRGELTKARDENAAHVRELQAMLRDQEGRLKSVSALAREHLADVNRMSVEVQSVREDLRTYQEAYADLWRDKHGGGPAPSPVTERDQLRAEVERLKAELKCWTQGRADLQPVDSDYNNALIGIRWALQDLGLRVKSDPEATKSAVEVLCVQLRKEGRAWTGEMLGGLTCPSQMQKEDNAALKQRVFTALGTELLYRLERHHDLKPDLVAQFDLLGRDL